MPLARSIFTAIAVLATSTLSVQAQTPGSVSPNSPSPTAVIRGRVTAADTGLPIPRAQVRLIRAAAATAAAAAGTLTGTDDQGRFEYTDVAPGRYTITAERSGFVKSSYGQAVGSNAGRPFDLKAGDVIERIDMTLTSGGSVVVHVNDDRGEPYAGAQVDLERYRYLYGVRRLETASAAMTDESGVVRFSALPPGNYYLVAIPASGRLVTVGANYSGRILTGARSVDDAMVLKVQAGQELNVDLAFSTLSTVTVSGKALWPNGEPIVGRIGLIRPVLESFSANVGAPNAGIQSDGSFTLSNVVPGRYLLSPVDDAAPRTMTLTPIDVSGDISGLIVTASKGGTVRGRLLFDGAKPPTSLRREQAACLTVPSFCVHATVLFSTVRRGGQFHSNDDGTFELTMIIGTSVLRPNLSELPPGWFLKSVTLDGKDITETMVDFSSADLSNVDVTFTQKHTEVTGGATDSRNAPISQFVAVIFPEDRERWTPQTLGIAAARPDAQGRFTVTGLPPGRYLGAAISSLDSGGAENDPELLQRLERGATRFTLAEDERKSITLRLVP